MHDGLAQVLGYLNLQVQTIEALHLSGKNNLLEKEFTWQAGWKILNRLGI